jgi:hypothetical protein
LVVMGGKLRLCSGKFAERLPSTLIRRMFRFVAAGREVFCDQNVVELYRKTALVLGTDFLLAGKQVTL